MASNIEIVGLPGLERKLGRLPRKIVEAAKLAVHQEVKETAQDERRLAPKLTGALADSVQEEFTGGGLRGSVAPRERYAQFVNDGARGVPPRPFATAAGKLARRRFRKRTIKLVDQAMARLSKG